MFSSLLISTACSFRPRITTHFGRLPRCPFALSVPKCPRREETWAEYAQGVEELQQGWAEKALITGALRAGKKAAGTAANAG
jgi:hypothetical protein